jgi:IS30 family transposase
MLEQGFKKKDIALKIGKDKSVLSRELKRNCDQRSKEYHADLAERKYQQRQRDKPKHIYFTDDIKQYVNESLKKDYSPEQISGRANLEEIKCVSHERIYQYIWKDKKEGGKLHEHLRHKGRKYRKRGAAKDKRGIIKNRVDIDMRPKIVDLKERFGDLEIDTMIGKNHKGALLTINDRAARIVLIQKLDGKEAKPVTKKTIKALKPIRDMIHTITADNGKEFADHETIAKKLKIDMFFAKPYHSWERGANENMNGLIRQYFPKGSSFENITDEDVRRVQDILNNRPRKELGFLTPYEYFDINFGDPKVAFIT